MTGFTDDDLWRFGEGTHDGLSFLLGAQLDGDSCRFGVWAPSAIYVSVMGDFNSWDPDAHPMFPTSAGIWTVAVDGVRRGDVYKYRVVTTDGIRLDKADPVGFLAEEPPRTGSRVWTLEHDWADGDWMRTRRDRNAHDAPLSVYELHLGSWRYEPGGYLALADQLAEHLERTGFTHVELMPVMEHPFYGSWGYQTTGYFAATSRYGEPQGLMHLVDHLHQRGIGVLLDWVPSHFPIDSHGLAQFDGTHLYEHADPRLGFHPDWRSAIFNYERHEVRSFLLSSARFWLERYHVDGLRVDAVASMLYRDYSRRVGEWIPNQFGGNENLAAISFLQELNRRVYLHHPDTVMVAEESTAWPKVSRPTDEGGLGFGFKWDMGWMNDTLRFFALEPIHRKHHHNELTFRMVYAFDENFVLPLSHDEVVHGKGSLLARMPGDRWQQLAGLRSLFGYQFGLPGKKLLFMGAELAMPDEWNHEQELPWGLLADPAHAGVCDWIGRLNRILRAEPALHVDDATPAGFSWVIGDDADNGVLAFLRRAPGARPVLVVVNLTPVPRADYRIGVPASRRWEVLACSDDAAYGGSGVVVGAGDTGEVEVVAEPSHGHDQSVQITVPPLSAVFLAPTGPERA